MNLAFNLLIVKTYSAQFYLHEVSIEDFLSKWERIRRYLEIHSSLLNKSLNVKFIFVQSLELYRKSRYWWSTETFCSSINVCGLISGDLRDTAISNLVEEWEFQTVPKIFLVGLPVPAGSSQKKEDLTLKRLCWILVHQRQGKTLLDAWNFDQFYSDCKIKWNWVTSIFSKTEKIQKKGALATSLHKKWSFPLRISSVNVTKQ